MKGIESREGPFQPLKKGEPAYRVVGTSTLLIDIIGFSDEKTSENMERIVVDLHTIIYRLASEAFYWGRKKSPNEIILTPTGDGYAVTFNPTVSGVSILEWTLKVWKRIVESFNYRIRMGIHSAPNYIHTDVNEVQNVTGWGIVGAQRVMGLAEENQILCSAAFAEPLRHDVRELHEVPGEYSIKHRGTLRIYNYYKKDEFGNPAHASPERRTRKKKKKKKSKKRK